MLVINILEFNHKVSTSLKRSNSNRYILFICSYLFDMIFDPQHMSRKMIMNHAWCTMLVDNFSRQFTLDNIIFIYFKSCFLNQWFEF